jgi:hypothetical protein
MLHAVGVGVYWDPALDSLLVDKDLPTVGYTGAEGIAGCRAVGGVTSCASTVPVENVGGPATVNAHWRESVFGNELMTGYLNNGANPLSLMTVRSLTDLGFGVNTLAADPYTIAAGSLRASLMLGASSTAPWERARTPRTISLPIVRVPR